MVRGYAAHYRLPIEDEALTREALAWAIGRGARSGRVAFQYIQDVAGRLGVRLEGENQTLILKGRETRPSRRMHDFGTCSRRALRGARRMTSTLMVLVGVRR